LLILTILIVQHRLNIALRLSINFVLNDDLHWQLVLTILVALKTLVSASIA
jgi:hypothetical protein